MAKYHFISTSIKRKILFVQTTKQNFASDSYLFRPNRSDSSNEISSMNILKKIYLFFSFILNIQIKKKKVKRHNKNVILLLIVTKKNETGLSLN
jgi:hypothetical protein